MHRPSRLAIVAAFAGVYLIWGSTYLAILFAIHSIPPMLMAGARFLCAGGILYVIARLTGASRSSLVEWRTAFIVGACLLLGGNGGVTLSEQYVPSGLAALLVATVPLYIALLSWLFKLSERPTPVAALGLAGGFVGVGLLVGPALRVSDSSESPQAWIGICILLVSSLVWSAGSLYSRHAKNATSPFLAAAQQMLCGGALMFCFGLLRGELHRLDLGHISNVSLGAFIYLVLIGGIIGYASYAFLLRYCEPAMVATYAYVNPIVAVALGALFAGEKLSLRTALAALLIIGSVAFVITLGSRKKAFPLDAPAIPAATV
ncbi:MAG: EamA family transporter [Verrucomicrobiota bacterium]|nr:EamA family transporter [Verrucomicrobiota bacterium]